MKDDSSSSKRRELKHRDIRPLQPQRALSFKIDEKMVHETKLRRMTHPPCGSGFLDNFYFSSDLEHVRENAKRKPRPVVRKASFNTADNKNSTLCLSKADDAYVTDTDDNEDCHHQDETKQRSNLLQRPSYHDRWNAAFAKEGRGRTPRQGSSPSLVDRLESLSSRHGCDRSIASTISSLSSVSNFSGASLAIG